VTFGPAPSGNIWSSDRTPPSRVFAPTMPAARGRRCPGRGLSGWQRRPNMKVRNLNEPIGGARGIEHERERPSPGCAPSDSVMSCVMASASWAVEAGAGSRSWRGHAP
jgi:hypothetical protein